MVAFHTNLGICALAMLTTGRRRTHAVLLTPFLGTSARSLTSCPQEAYTCGMMTGQCVRATTLDALEEGFAAVCVIEDACRGCDGPEDDRAVLKEMAAKGAKIVSIQVCL